MKYVMRGRPDLKVSRICMGCMGFGDPAAMPGSRRRPMRWQRKKDEQNLFPRRGIKT